MQSSNSWSQGRPYRIPGYFQRQLVAHDAGRGPPLSHIRRSFMADVSHDRNRVPLIGLRELALFLSKVMAMGPLDKQPALTGNQVLPFSKLTTAVLGSDQFFCPRLIAILPVISRSSALDPRYLESHVPSSNAYASCTTLMSFFPFPFSHRPIIHVRTTAPSFVDHPRRLKGGPKDPQQGCYPMVMWPP